MKLLHAVLFDALLLPLSIAAQSGPSPLTVEAIFEDEGLLTIEG